MRCHLVLWRAIDVAQAPQVFQMDKFSRVHPSRVQCNQGKMMHANGSDTMLVKLFL